MVCGSVRHFFNEPLAQWRTPQPRFLAMNHTARGYRQKMTAQHRYSVTGSCNPLGYTIPGNARVVVI
jgi:hypothetical protein